MQILISLSTLQAQFQFICYHVSPFEEKKQESIPMVRIVLDCGHLFYISVSDSQATNTLLVQVNIYLSQHFSV